MAEFVGFAQAFDQDKYNKCIANCNSIPVDKFSPSFTYEKCVSSCGSVAQETAEQTAARQAEEMKLVDAPRQVIAPATALRMARTTMRTSFIPLLQQQPEPEYDYGPYYEEPKTNWLPWLVILGGAAAIFAATVSIKGKKVTV